MNDLYREYMSDYIEEATKEMNNSLGITADEEKGKKDVYKHNFFLKEVLQDKYVKDVLSKPDNRNKIGEFLAKFIDDHMDQLSTSGPVNSFTFGDKETKIFYELFNIDKDTILDIWFKMIDETYYGKISKFFTGWIENAPHKLLFGAITIEAIQKNYEDIIECMTYLWPLCEYPMLFREYWRTSVRSDVMDYTIERLGNKFKIKAKNLNTLLALLHYDGKSALMSHYEKLKEGADNSYADFLQRNKSQLNNTLKNISREYYRNIESNATQHKQVEEFEDGSKAEQEGNQTNIAAIVDNTITKMTSTEMNLAFIRMTAEAAKVDKDNLKNFINLIMADKNNRMTKFIEDILIAFFEKNPTASDIGGNFVNFALSLYKSIGISKNEVYSEIRNILNYWMFEIIDIRKMYQREPTVISYTRAIYNYFIFLINSFN